jgi:hypothetical protein
MAVKTNSFTSSTSRLNHNKRRWMARSLRVFPRRKISKLIVIGLVCVSLLLYNLNKYSTRIIHEKKKKRKKPKKAVVVVLMVDVCVGSCPSGNIKVYLSLSGLWFE